MGVFLVLVLNFIFTWLIGLAIPAVLRFVILRRPLGRTWALVIAGAVFVFNVLLFTYIKYSQEGYSSEGEISYVQGFIALAAYHILRRPKRNKTNGSDTHVQTASLNPKSHKRRLLKPIVISFIILTFTASIAGAFYWYEIRPASIRQKCSETAKAESDKLSVEEKYYFPDRYEAKKKQAYDDCLHSKGL